VTKSDSTTLFLVRHGETVANAEMKICGASESPLTDGGLRRVRELAEKIRAFPFDVAFTSPLERARLTCGAIWDGRDKEAIVLDDLREQEFGQWEGLSFKEITGKDADAFRRFYKDPLHAKAPGGEAFSTFFERVRRAVFDEMIAGNRGRRILCVCHGGSIRAALCHLLDLDVQRHYFRFTITNATVNVVRLGTKGARLFGLGLADLSHLDL